MATIEQSRAVVEDQQQRMIAFLKRMVSTPSQSGAEGDVAAIIQNELKQLDFDEVWVDEVGNIIGKIDGSGGPTILLNGHMDVVDPGPADGWPHAAYGGEVVAGELWGRGSVDMKGPVAAMIYAAAQFKQLGVQPPGDVLMTVVVMEETGGLGTQFLMTHTTADAAIVGEPSRNELRLGHRGRILLQVTFFGRSAHASAPVLAVNPHFDAAEFLKKLPNMPLGSDLILGPSTVVPTLYLTDQRSANVIPSEVTLFLDWRNTPEETPEVAVAKIESLLKTCLFYDAASAGIQPPKVTVKHDDQATYTGAMKDFASVFPPFATSPTSPMALAAKSVIEESTGNSASPDVWQFATDGGHLVAAGVPTIGFGPGDYCLAHTNQERLCLADLKTAAATYAPLTVALAEAIESS